MKAFNIKNIDEENNLYLNPLVPGDPDDTNITTLKRLVLVIKHLKYFL